MFDLKDPNNKKRIYYLYSSLRFFVVKDYDHVF